ncbi:MAG: serine hydrolase, partial [Actinobacteria bacterium]|nr:serine hydrolase [Actinomycetota bacterium]
DSRFALQVDLPPRELDLDVVGVADDGRRARTRVANVQGMPAVTAPAVRPLRLDPSLQPRLRQRARGYPGTSAFYVVDLLSGRGAAWNAQAELPAASSLKVAIAVVALARAGGSVPAPGSRLDTLLRKTLLLSDNESANELEIFAAGSTSGGSYQVNAMMRELGLLHTDMYGAYLREPSAAGPSRQPIPLRVDEQPDWGPGKRSTAYDLGMLLREVWLASGGLGTLVRLQPGFTPADARYLLYLLARVPGGGKLDRFLTPASGVALLHKAGWIDAARHDTGLLVWPGGIVLASVMTYRKPGVGEREDALAGWVAVEAMR